MQTSTWSRTLELIHAPRPAPSIAWPAERIRRYSPSDADDHDDTAVRLQRNASDDQVVAAIATLGAVRITDLSSVASISKQAAHSRLMKLERDGRLRRDGTVWRVMPP